MEVVPAVDIMKGKVVRLLRGDPGFSKSYESLGDPVTVARRWEDEGARIIHVVDLDAALGLGSNRRAVEEISRTVSVPIQVGGGVRDLETARALFDSGIHRLVIGSLAYREPSAVKTLLEEYGERRVAVALDNLGGVIRVHGWKDTAKVSVHEAALKYSRMGVRLFLVTSVDRDGTMSGPDLETIGQIRSLNLDVIAAGGIGSLEDLRVLKSLGAHGVVVGKALYEGLFTLSEALRAVGTV